MGPIGKWRPSALWILTWEGVNVKFSERYGFTKARDVFQIDSINAELRNSLWSILTIELWDTVRPEMNSRFFSANPEIKSFLNQVWFKYFKSPVDTLHNNWKEVRSELRSEFFQCEWFEVYNFIEFVVQHYPWDDKDAFIQSCNATLRAECSAYRIVGNQIARITDPEEISAIDAALNSKVDNVRTHLARSLELLSNRERPDYRNSVKESISAIEALVSSLLGEKGTLGEFVKKLEGEIGLHPALGKALSSLYGYTSDASGIRHALLEKSSVSFDEAKFFLVICSAFANFVKAKP
jgi:AbiJ N-terminal domain 4